jgi:hypothetical protein
MRRLPKKIQQIIKRERFTLNSTRPDERYTQGVDIKYRISGITTDDAKWYEESTPMDKDLNQDIWVNIKVSGMAETRDYQDEGKSLKPIGEVAKFKQSGYNCSNPLWGWHYHKRIRNHIRQSVNSEIRDFLKLMGIAPQRWYQLKIKTISWE